MGDMAMWKSGMSRKRRHAREVWRAKNKRDDLHFAKAGWVERMALRLITDEQFQGNENNENKKTHAQAVLCC